MKEYLHQAEAEKSKEHYNESQVINRLKQIIFIKYQNILDFLISFI